MSILMKLTIFSLILRRKNIYLYMYDFANIYLTISFACLRPKFDLRSKLSD